MNDLNLLFLDTKSILSNNMKKEQFKALEIEKIGHFCKQNNYKIVLLSKAERKIETIQELRKHLIAKGGQNLLDHLFYYRGFYKVSEKCFECNSLYIDDFFERFNSVNLLFNLKDFKILINDEMGRISMYSKKTFKKIENIK